MFPRERQGEERVKKKMTDPATTPLIGYIKHSNEVQMLFSEKQEKD